MARRPEPWQTTECPLEGCYWAAARPRWALWSAAEAHRIDHVRELRHAPAVDDLPARVALRDWTDALRGVPV